MLLSRKNYLPNFDFDPYVSLLLDWFGYDYLYHKLFDLLSSPQLKQLASCHPNLAPEKSKKEDNKIISIR